MAKHKIFSYPTERRHPHFRQQGGSKYPHTTWESAVESAKRMTNLRGFRFEPYQCPTCERFHIGRGICDSHKLYEQEMDRIELGERVTAHLTQENQIREQKKINHIADLALAAVRRAMYPDYWHGHRHGRTGKKAW